MTSSTSYRVRFTEMRDWLDELKADREHVERSIVRIARRVQPPLEAVGGITIIATAIIDGRLVILERYCGELWGIAQTDEQTQRSASDLVKALNGAAAELELEVRAGVIEEVPDA